MSNTSRTVNRPSWSSNDFTAFISSITIPQSNDDSASSIERLLIQKLQTDFNLGENADSELYADLSRAFIQWRIRLDCKGQELNHNRNNPNSNANSGHRSNDRTIEMNDSDLSIASHYSSKSLSSLNSYIKVETKSNRSRMNRGNRGNIMHVGISESQDAVDSDLEEDYLSANDSSDIDDMNEDDDVEEDREKVVQKMSSMNIDPADNTTATTSNCAKTTNEEKPTANDDTTVPNNLLKEFELMGRNIKFGKEDGKENEEPLQQPQQQQQQSPSGPVASSDHFTSSFRNIHINNDINNGDESSKFKSHKSPNDDDRDVKHTNNASPKNVHFASPKVEEIATEDQQHQTSTTSFSPKTPHTEQKQYRFADISFGGDMSNFDDESVSDLFTPETKNNNETKDKEKQDNDDDIGSVSNVDQEQTQQQPTQSFNFSSIFNVPVGLNTDASTTELKFNVDLSKSKSKINRGSPRSRRSRFKKSTKKVNPTSQSTESSGMQFDFPSATPTVNTFNVDTPKTMDIDSPQAFPTPPAETERNFEGQAFNIGVGGTPSKKGIHPHRRNRSSLKTKVTTGSALRNSVKAKPPTPEHRARSLAQPKFTSSYENLLKETKVKEFETKLESIRKEAKILYSNEKYHESVLKFTDAIIFLTNDFKSIPKPTKKPVESETLASIYGNRAAALMMISAYDAASSDCAKGIAHLQGFNPLAMKVENQEDVMSYFKPDGGLILMSKLSARMCRAHMKLGNVTEAELAIKQTIRISEIAVRCHQKILSHASRKGLCVPDEMMKSSEKALVHCRSNATLNKSDLHKMKEQIEAINSVGGVVKDTEIKLARRRSNDIYPRIEDILKIAPANVEMQESKVLCLASMRRWTELISYCESVAYSISSTNAVYIADLKSLDPFPDLSSNTTFNITAGRQLNAKEVAYVAKWMPRQRVAPLYVRALRLEERYLEASKACEALASFTGIDEPIWSPNHKREKKMSQILEKELQKINDTMLMKEEGDKLYREGKYEKAAEKYASVLLVDGDKTSFFAQEPWDCETAGGRLHAVLHCNRAACLMALKKFGEAAKECSAALKVQKKYMKAMLRRARCYARIARFEESISEYNRWSGLVQEARANPYAMSDDECMFDRACDVSDLDHQRAMAELTEVMKMKAGKEEKDRQAKENARRRASSAFDRRQKWYDQQESKGSRPWDSFNGTSPKKDRSNSKRDNNKFPRASSFRSTNRTNKNQTRSDSHSNSYRQSKKDVERPSPSSNSVTCHYSVLQINSTASQNDIKKAYHKFALKYHPDKNKTDGAADIFRKVKLAYETLSDDRQRRLYDVERLRSSSRRF